MAFNRIKPTALRLEACSRCQLRCAACPTHGPGARPVLDQGVLKFSDFKKLIDDNPGLRSIELANYGEIFLNPELAEILEYAYEHGVALKADDGVNLNRVSDEVLEALVRYRMRSMTCSIDGASQETYSQYRVNGDLPTVIRNVQKLNEFKRKYGSDYPTLAWQFVVFSHNEHEIAQARGLAEALRMSFHLKLSWDPDLAVLQDEEALRREIGAANRDEYRERFGVDYNHRGCMGMWNRPQIDWDGTVLGCCRNFWADYGANAFSEGLIASVNNLRMRYARAMLLGKKPPREDIPCATCENYEHRRSTGRWIRKQDLRAERWRFLKNDWSQKHYGSLAYRSLRFAYRGVGNVRGLLKRALGGGQRLSSRVYPIGIPLPTHPLQDWIPYGVFRGATKSLPILTCHASVLAKGVIPHAPHAHGEEEVLIVLGGALDLIVPDAASPDGLRRTHLGPGQFVYYPLEFAHTVEATSDEPANYLMFKWSGKQRRTRSPLRHGAFTAFGPDAPAEVKDGFSSRMFFAGPTNMLRKLSCHTSTLTPGAGYEPHADPYDVAIVILDGEVETLGKRVGPCGVIFYAEGEPHGMRNPGETIAKYVVFELHGRRGLLRASRARLRFERRSLSR